MKVFSLYYKETKEWLPPSSPTNTYDWERCLSLMRGKLR